MDRPLTHALASCSSLRLPDIAHSEATPSLLIGSTPLRACVWLVKDRTSKYPERKSPRGGVAPDNRTFQRPVGTSKRGLSLKIACVTPCCSAEGGPEPKTTCGEYHSSSSLGTKGSTRPRTGFLVPQGSFLKYLLHSETSALHCLNSGIESRSEYASSYGSHPIRCVPSGLTVVISYVSSACTLSSQPQSDRARREEF